MSNVVEKWTRNTTGAANINELHTYQMQKVNSIVKYVKENSIFYKNRLLDISDVKTITDLPFTLPEHLEQHSHLMLCVSQSMVNRVITYNTSGTTGGAKRIFFNEHDQSLTVNFFEYGMKEFTKENDNVLILFPGKNEGSIGQLLAKALRQFNANPIIYGIVHDYADLFKFVENKEINVIAGLPRQVFMYSRLCRHYGVNNTKLHSVLISADCAADYVIQSIEQNLMCNVYNHYGMGEMCYGGGVHAKGRSGYHMRHSDFLFEIVDTKTGEPVKPGQWGEIVFTSFNIEAMPLIRYKTGDISRFLPNNSIFPLLDEIAGRVNEEKITVNGDIITLKCLDEIVFKNENILDYTAYFDGNVLTLHVHSLAFDEGKLCEAIKNSGKGRAVEKIKILPASLLAGSNNSTMVKRKINYTT